MIPGQHTLRIRKHRELRRVFTWKINGTPVDLRGYSARLHIRHHVPDTEPILALTSDVDGGIELGDAAGTITLTRTAEQTGNLAKGMHTYDLELTPSAAQPFTLLEGPAEIRESVTR